MRVCGGRCFDLPAIAGRLARLSRLGFKMGDAAGLPMALIHIQQYEAQ